MPETFAWRIYLTNAGGSNLLAPQKIESHGDMSQFIEDLKTAIARLDGSGMLLRKFMDEHHMQNIANR